MYIRSTTHTHTHTHRGDVVLENPLHEQEARRLFDGMLQALQDVSTQLSLQEPYLTPLTIEQELVWV